MKLKVPFFGQTTPLNCGPTALRIVLTYIGEDPGIEILEGKTGIRDGEGISTIKLATVSAEMGYKTELYSKYISFNEDNLKLDFYKKHGDINLEQSEKWLENANSVGVNLQEKVFSLKELLDLVTEDSLPIVLVDWNVVLGEKEKDYHGHFIVLVGYDNENVYVHNTSFESPQEFLSIKKEVFEEARKAEGTDEDIVVVHRA
jgi:hypothetical protein